MRSRWLGGLLAGAIALTPFPSRAFDYSTASFSVSTNAYTFGQAPVFAPNGRVVFAKDYGAGAGQQVYSAAGLEGSDLRCLTCVAGAPAAPNGVPAVRPQNDWVLFHSWDKRVFRLGAPGFGGLGSALYVVRADGSPGVVQLTGLDAAHGSGEGEDDYHAYWSPDGNRIVYAHLNWNFVNDGGNGNWDVRVADFVELPSPHLENVRVVRPANGHYYETQWWAPDGSGFLYTESTGTTMNLELFFCRLSDTGCDVQQLTNDSAWDEQALFTPDMRSVIFMSTRDHPGFFNTFTTLAQDAGTPADADYLLILPLFEAGFLQPVAQEATDLYELTLATGSVRRLTHNGDDGWIIPEFAWDPANQFLFWTEARYPDGVRVPLPVDLMRQVQQTVVYLQGFEPSVPDVTPGSISPLPLERRTEIGRFG